MPAYSLGGGLPVVQWAELFERTREWLRAHVLGTGPAELDLQFVATMTLQQIDLMRDGCRWLVRVDRAPHWRACLRSSDLIPVYREPGYGPPRLRPVTGADLASWRQAAAIFGTIPDVPGDAVTFPGRLKSYASIPVPQEPVEAIERLEEIESTIWGLAAPRRSGRVDPEPVRRTYAFFDVGLWLVRSLFGKA